MKKKSAKSTKKEIKTDVSLDVSKSNKSNIFLWIILSCIFGYLHMTHIETLFENDKHFSHLSNLERELSFRTESALYYYYFKLLVSNESINKASDLILNDDRTEHPSTINSLKRFNLYSELISSFFYRVADFFKLLNKQCWQINRGDDMPPVESCVGYSEPIYFYVKSVFVLNGFSLAFLFTLCWLINRRSITSGILGCICYFYNHGESTRVMWTPALRESFSFPFHLLQMVFLTTLLQKNKISKFNLISFISSTVLYLLTWQFAQFSLGSQMMSLFATYSIGYLSRGKLLYILIAQSFSLIICYVLMFANRMLMTSLFASLLCSIWFLIFFEYILKINDNFKLHSIFKKIFITIIRVSMLFILIFISKKYILKLVFQQEEDDSHVWDILKSKFDQKSHTFDTRLYTCAKEFDFLETETITKICKTFLLPFAMINFVFYAFKLLIDYFSKNDSKGSTNDLDTQAVIVYNIFQVIAFSLMAFLIMRLKLFLIPHLCVFVSLFCNNSDDSVLDFAAKMINHLKLLILDINKFKMFVIILLIALMSYQGVENIKQQHEIQGEYSDYTMETIMNWVNKNTKRNDSFTASMPLSANLKLSTNRRITNHPHYEDIDLRKKVKTIYSYLYGFRPVNELHDILKNKFKSDYLIIEKHYCMGHPPGKPECAMSELSHLNMERTVNKQACALIFNQEADAPKYFLKKFQSSHISVFKVMPT